MNKNSLKLLLVVLLIILLVGILFAIKKGKIIRSNSSKDAEYFETSKESNGVENNILNENIDEIIENNTNIILTTNISEENTNNEKDESSGKIEEIIENNNTVNATINEDKPKIQDYNNSTTKLKEQKASNNENINNVKIIDTKEKTQNTTSREESKTIKEEKLKSIYDYEFDIEAIRKELIEYGENMGLKHIVEDEGRIITPENSSWCDFVTASKSFQGARLEKALKDYVSYTPKYVKTYGDGVEIKYFTIFVEDIGNGRYNFYFLY